MCNAISCCTPINTNGTANTRGSINLAAHVNANGDSYGCQRGQILEPRRPSSASTTAGATLTFYALGGPQGVDLHGSDERLKKNIGPASGDALARNPALGLISFDMPFPDVPTRHFDYGFSRAEY